MNTPILIDALHDAINYRDPWDSDAIEGCRDCTDELCPDHAADAEQARRYRVALEQLENK